MQAGDRVPAGPLSVRLDIERAPFAAKSLFSRPVIKSIFLSSTPPNQPNAALGEEIREFTPLAEGERWEALFPIGEVPAADSSEDFSGCIFLYYGGRELKVINANPHFSIRYRLQIVDGRLDADSDLRMGVNYVTPAVIVPPPDKIPVDEWFSDRPLPEIVGGNTSDPTLLGVQPHEKRLETTLKDDKPKSD